MADEMEMGEFKPDEEGQQERQEEEESGEYEEETSFFQEFLGIDVFDKVQKKWFRMFLSQTTSGFATSRFSETSWNNLEVFTRRRVYA